MQRHERIRFFITEQCRNRDPTFRNHLFPKQILLGDQVLPLLEGSTMTFRINEDKKISFRIRLMTDDENFPLNIGMTLTQIESISIKEPTKKHPEPAIVFLLKNRTLDRLIAFVESSVENPVGDGNRRSMSRYLTVLLRTDPDMEDSKNKVYCRIICQMYKFTFPFTVMKKQLMKDLSMMWQELIDDEFDKRHKTGTTYDRERVAEMDDEAWDWFMGFMKFKWESYSNSNYWLAKRQIVVNEEVVETSVVNEAESSQLSNEHLMLTHGSESTDFAVSVTASPEEC